MAFLTTEGPSLSVNQADSVTAAVASSSHLNIDIIFAPSDDATNFIPPSFVSSHKYGDRHSLHNQPRKMSTGSPAVDGGAEGGKTEQHVRSNSFSQQSTTSETSQTAAEYV